MQELEFHKSLHIFPGNIEYLLLLFTLSRVRLFATPCTTACQASLSFTASQSLLRLTSIESVIPSNHLILCHPLFLLPSIFPSIRVFSNESSVFRILAFRDSFGCPVVKTLCFKCRGCRFNPCSGKLRSYMPLKKSRGGMSRFAGLIPQNWLQSGTDTQTKLSDWR